MLALALQSLPGPWFRGAFGIKVCCRLEHIVQSSQLIPDLRASAAITDQIKDVLDTLANFEKKIEKENEALRTRVANLEKKNETLRTRVANLERRTETLTTSAANLEKRIETLTTNTATLEKKKETLTTVMANLEQRNSEELKCIRTVLYYVHITCNADGVN